MPANSLLVTAVLVLAYGVIFTFESQNLRLLVAVAAVTQSVAVGLLARGERRSQLQQVALMLGVIGGVQPAVGDAIAFGVLEHPLEGWRTLVAHQRKGALLALPFSPGAHNRDAPSGPGHPEGSD